MAIRTKALWKLATYTRSSSYSKAQAIELIFAKLQTTNILPLRIDALWRRKPIPTRDVINAVCRFETYHAQWHVFLRTIQIIKQHSTDSRTGSEDILRSILMHLAAHAL